MDNRKAKSGIWSEIIASDSELQAIAKEEEKRRDRTQNQVQPIYHRRRQTPTHSSANTAEAVQPPPIPRNRLTLAAAHKRDSWNRSLSTRGRTSIAVGPFVKNQPQQKQGKRRGKPPLPKGHVAEPPSFDKEREYFQEVDAFELVEESPSPKNSGTWVVGNQSITEPVPHVSSRLEKWLSKKLNLRCEPSSTLSKILETPATLMDSAYISDWDFTPATLKDPIYFSDQDSAPATLKDPIYTSDDQDSGLTTPEKCNKISTSSAGEGFKDVKDIDAAIRKLSLASTATSVDIECADSFASLLEICKQSTPLKLLDLFSKYCDPENIVKIGEGTYGEAFKAGNTVCKIVPFDGDFPVNGEVQKKSEELLEEAVLSQTLNTLRKFENDVFNACMTFIETIDLKVCQGRYDAALIRAWEKWDDKNSSENDHPKEFPEKQRYVVFVLQHGGKDLESFVLENFDEARSLLVQVTAALAVAEAAYEFEHRDLHWGNILLCRNDSVTTKFILEGKQMFLRTFGLSISIIDFTLSKINTGKNILFLDLSMDPYLFKGPKGDKQSETYRKMKEVTEDNWEGSFPRTNVLWLLYLVDILLLKKTFVRSSKNERDLRSLKKRLEKYDSAKEAIFDPFFEDLLMEHAKPCE